jgi:EAL domain-containing protein (putative c-di-GMP-specific phosphodiesterase class I)
LTWQVGVLRKPFLAELSLALFDKLKVDQSFMTDLAVEGGGSREVLSTIIALGRVLGLKITAEGVETQEQAEVLRALDCDLLQGYLLGRPMRAIDVAA